MPISISDFFLYPFCILSLNRVSYFLLFQREFIRDFRTNEHSKKVWSIPVTFTTSSNMDFNITDIQWLNTDSSPLEILLQNDSWIILNLQQSGEYENHYIPFP